MQSRLLEREFSWQPGEAIGITGKKRGGRMLFVCNRRATQPVISRASLATGGYLVGALLA